MSVLIRPATLADLETVRELNHELFLWDFPNDTALNTDWPYQAEGEAYFRGKITGKTGTCFVAEKDGVIVGYIEGHVNKEVDPTDTLLRCELDTIYVQAPERGDGTGQDLVDAFSAWCKEKGAQSMVVEAYAGNRKAVEFYKKYGFGAYVEKLERKL